MGLLNFLKSAGKSIFGGGAQAAEPEKLKEEIAAAGLDASKFEVALEGDKVVLKGAAATQEEREKAILAVGNVEGVATVEDSVEVAAPEPESVFHTVEKGDTLSAIAKKHYGDANKYMKIFDANKPMLSHPDKIYPGQVLRIPA
ncbi:MAG: peptidoglycan-binding protein LysM [Rubrimonas sp.]|uniref:peptidoglycan-binding protein LysM n=1 Tax=Rubrimonas sp. TaxID=2036015 RepID=UPI002FDF07D8